MKNIQIKSTVIFFFNKSLINLLEQIFQALNILCAFSPSNTLSNQITLFPIFSCKDNHFNLGMSKVLSFSFSSFSQSNFFSSSLIPSSPLSLFLTYCSNFNISKLRPSLATWAFPKYFWGEIICQVLIDQMRNSQRQNWELPLVCTALGVDVLIDSSNACSEGVGLAFDCFFVLFFASCYSCWCLESHQRELLSIYCLQACLVYSFGLKVEIFLCCLCPHHSKSRNKNRFIHMSALLPSYFLILLRFTLNHPTPHLTFPPLQSQSSLSKNLLDQTSSNSISSTKCQSVLNLVRKKDIHSTNLFFFISLLIFFTLILIIYFSLVLSQTLCCLSFSIFPVVCLNHQITKGMISFVMLSVHHVSFPDLFLSVLVLLSIQSSAALLDSPCYIHILVLKYTCDSNKRKSHVFWGSLIEFMGVANPAPIIDGTKHGLDLFPNQVPINYIASSSQTILTSLKAGMGIYWNFQERERQGPQCGTKNNTAEQIEKQVKPRVGVYYTTGYVSDKLTLLTDTPPTVSRPEKKVRGSDENSVVRTLKEIDHI
ncbi:hypothetical protein VP01_1504g2 [Puccinia sorghi]|uniref:Uncharacterized protein n=1 Tax=Puccinia sorghi TaxID=27349 RepID=A0A0L6VJL4_9BASI|nr:hypothetical protein VP01_1504g2 [Puccinia sorghi]